MVTKAEIYGGGGASRLSRGIEETISRRQQEYEETQEAKLQEEINTAREYEERLNKGEISNINQIPQNVRKYFNFEEVFQPIKENISSEIQKAIQKEQEIKKTYEEKFNRLIEWRSESLKRADNPEKRDEIRNAYALEKEELRKDYYPDIKYYSSKANEMKKKLNEIDKGELLSEEYIRDFAEQTAKYEQRSEDLRRKQDLRSAKAESVGSYVERINRGEIKIKDVPFNLRKYIDVKTEKVEEGVTQRTTPSGEDILGIGAPEIPDFVKPAKQRYDSEIKRYEDLGYKKDEARLLAEKSLEQGGMTFTPDYAKRLIVESKIEKNIREKNQEIASAIREVFSGKEAYRFNTLRETLDSLNKVATSILDRVSYATTKREYEEAIADEQKLRKAVENSRKDLVQLTGGAYVPPEVESLKAVEDNLKDIEARLKLGLSTPSAQVQTIGADIASDFIVPGKAALDITLLVNQLLPTQAQINAFYNRIKEEGFKDTLKKMPSEVGNKIENFFTNKEQRKEIEDIKKENEQTIKETRSLINSNKVDKNQAEQFIRDIESQNKELEMYDKTLSEDSLLTIGTVGFLAAGAAGRLIRRIRAKKINFDYNYAKRSADELNKIDEPPIREKRPYVADTYRDLNKVDFADKKAISNAVPSLKGVGLDDIDNVKVDVQSTEYLGKSYVKKVPSTIKLKNLITDKTTKSRRVPPSSNVRVPYYTISRRPNYWVNNINVAVTLSDGTVKTFSLISKSNKPIPNYRKLSNLIKYGTNKKVLVGQLIPDSEIFGAIQYSSRAGRLKVEDYWLGKRVSDDTVGVKRRGKITEDLIRDRNKIARMSPEEIRKLEKRTGLSIEEINRRIQENLSPEAYWQTGEPTALVRTTKKVKTQPIRRVIIRDDQILGFGFQRETGFRQVVNNDLKLDLSRFNFISQNYINNLKSLPKSQLSKSKKIFLNIAGEVQDATKKGKDSIVIDSKTLKQLSRNELLELQSSMASSMIPEIRFRKVVDNAKKSLSKINSQAKTITQTTNSISSKINRIGSDISLATWDGITSSKKDKTLSELNSLKNQTDSTLASLNKSASTLKEALTSLTKERQKTTDASQSAQLSQSIQSVASLSDQVNRLKDSLVGLRSNIDGSTNSVKRITPKTSQPTRPRVPGLPKRLERESPLDPFRRDFEVFTRRRGKDVKIGTRKTKKEAQKFLESHLDKTLRASGFIQKGKEKVTPGPLGKDFRRSKSDPWRIVEKRGSRLDSKSEVSSIQRAKRTKPSKPKKIKSAEDYWLS
jgi:hypothetical protein